MKLAVFNDARFLVKKMVTAGIGFGVVN